MYLYHCYKLVSINSLTLQKLFFGIAFGVLLQEMLFKEDNHWFSVPPKSKKHLIAPISNNIDINFVLRSNACAQSLSALCLIIILMLLQICRILCVIFVHSDVFRPCYSVEEGGGKILSFVLFVCWSVYRCSYVQFYDSCLQYLCRVGMY